MSPQYNPNNSNSRDYVDLKIRSAMAQRTSLLQVRNKVEKPEKMTRNRQFVYGGTFSLEEAVVLSKPKPFYGSREPERVLVIPLDPKPDKHDDIGKSDFVPVCPCVPPAELHNRREPDLILPKKSEPRTDR
jgi:hypothetical protein